MVADFVGAELTSARFGPQTRAAVAEFDVDSRILEQPNLNSPKENMLRANILNSCRGYLSRTKNFEGFPKRTKWFSVELDKADFEKLQYIDNPGNWNDLSKGTRFVRDGCDHIFGMPKRSNPARFVRSMYAELKRGVRMPPIIAVTDPKRTRLVILEGACRSTASYKAFQHKYIRKVAGLLGVSKRIDNWKHF